MRYPAGEKQKRSSGCQIQRVIQVCPDMKLIPYVVQCHDHHCDAANDVDGFNSVFSERGCHEAARKCFRSIISNNFRYPKSGDLQA